MISLTRVTKTYNGTPVLDGTTLQVASGECVRITGGPQSGRSTLLRVIATLVRPTSGTVSIDGIDAIRNPAAARHKVAYVTPEMVVGTSLRVDEYLRFVARTRGVSSMQRIAEVSERCGLHPRADVDRLTSDARAALAIAAALVASPAVLLLDDALGAVRDPERRVGIAEALREARSRGATLVVASNGSDDLTALSRRIVTLERGRLREGLPSLRQSGEATWAL